MRWVCGVVLLAGCAQGGRLVVSQPAPQPFCTRTLGVAECFADPDALPDHPAPLLDTPVRQHLECGAVWRNGGALCLLRQPGRP